DYHCQSYDSSLSALLF
nr:immunoglobulin light chain junction region [Macaca mulatta]MOX17204.1 immunoglobulin light chain junction region [Macaca mulatta]MOX17574.1 immunoglobulin light chain junction region [Macaca mulatta]MOX17773.1 immunoglobulin light chain junction region [Macaca mulatta]MOX17985.1 immunoglobulin light chain junction region [Macaca mulatta]